MKINLSLTQILTSIGFALVLASSTAIAHESRIISNKEGAQLRITAGNQPEPVFSGQLSRTDLFLNLVMPDESLVPVDVSAGASIEDLRVYVLFLKKEMHVDSIHDPLVRKSMEIHDIEQVSDTENRYQSPIIYTHPGAYGFAFKGTVVANDGSKFYIDEIFVCGGGSLAEPREDGSIPAFGCVQKPITFPGYGEKVNPDHHKDGYYFMEKLKK